MNSPPRINPTIGRIVLFHLSGTTPPADPARGNFMLAENDTYGAMVAAVISPSMVNLTVSDSWGNTFGRTSIPLVQEGEERPAGAWCEWMPYQKGQAAKAEQLERQIAAHTHQLTGEPPTLNTPVRDPQKLAEAIDLNERQAARRREDPDAPRLESDPERVQADLSRHPVIGAAQQLDNDGRPVDAPGTGPFDSPAPHIPQD